MRQHIIYLLAAGLCLAACQSKPADETSPKPAAPANVAAKVGPVSITEQEVNDRLALVDEDDREFAQTPIGRQNFINILVREKLSELAAKEAGVDSSDTYLSALEDKRNQLKEIYDDFAKQTLVRLWEQQLEDSGKVAVSDEEISAYYKKYPYEMTIKQIIISNAQTADQVLRTLKRSPSRWKEMERQYSVSPQMARGKEFSFMPGEFLPEIEVIAANSASGSVQGFIKTAQGFHIIMKTREKRLSLKDAAPRIRAILQAQKEDAVLNSLKNKYEVAVYEKNE